jgi:hypothetical protein
MEAVRRLAIDIKIILKAFDEEESKSYKKISKTLDL